MGCQFQVAPSEVGLSSPICTTVQLFTFNRSPHRVSVRTPVGMNPKALWVPTWKIRTAFLCFSVPRILRIRTSISIPICFLFLCILSKCNKDLRSKQTCFASLPSRIQVCNKFILISPDLHFKTPELFSPCHLQRPQIAIDLRDAHHAMSSLAHAFCTPHLKAKDSEDGAARTASHTLPSDCASGAGREPAEQLWTSVQDKK